MASDQEPYNLRSRATSEPNLLQQNAEGNQLPVVHSPVHDDAVVDVLPLNPNNENHRLPAVNLQNNQGNIEPLVLPNPVLDEAGVGALPPNNEYPGLPAVNPEDSISNIGERCRNHRSRSRSKVSSFSSSSARSSIAPIQLRMYSLLQRRQEIA